jgi:hypothetical protein
LEEAIEIMAKHYKYANLKVKYVNKGEVACLCGCGQTFIHQGVGNRKFYNDACRARYWRERREDKERYQMVEPRGSISTREMIDLVNTATEADFRDLTALLKARKAKAKI